MAKGTEKSASGTLGSYLADLRLAKGLTLRDVEDATGKDVSNAYLSQLEHGRIGKPSPNILHSLASVYGVAYETLMEKAGYITDSSQGKPGQKHGRAATFAIDNLTTEEEAELLSYLAFMRSKKGKREKG
jgi:transcriptional regulator with XRE-family HTH domain